MTVSDLLTVGVLAFVGIRLGEAARSSARPGSRSWELVRGLRLRHFVLAVPVVVAVLATAIGLFLVPGLSFGWWTALGGIGNPVVGSTTATRGSPLEIALPVCFGALLLVGLPVLVGREEWIFRRGAEARTTVANARRAVLFGLAHTVVGIPVAAALALSIGGGYLTWSYGRGWRRTGSQEGALLESSRSHLAYNLVIIGIVVGSLLLEVVLRG